MALQKNSELACTYAALMLHDEGLEITQDRIAAIVEAAGVQIESYYPMIFAKFLAGKCGCGFASIVPTFFRPVLGTLVPCSL